MAPKRRRNSRSTNVNRNTNNDATQPDRLSALPEGLICDILGRLLPNKAASTSVLSKPWRNIWTQVTHFSFYWHYNHYFVNNVRFPRNLEQDEKEQVLTMMDGVFTQLTSPKLTTFKLDISLERVSVYFQQFGDYLTSWVTHIYSKNPEKILLKIDMFYGPNNNNHEGLISLPGCVFQCKSLVSLEFGELSEFDFKFPDDGTIILPHLKKLSIYIHDSHCHLGVTLVRSCPVLEDLYFGAKFDEGDHLVELFGPHLTRLKLYLRGERGQEQCTKYSVFSPKLVSLDIDSSTFASYTFTNDILDDLVAANISVGDASADGGAYDHEAYAIYIISIVSGVRSLSLGGTMFGSLSERRDDPDSIPIFKNLTWLRLADGWRNLMAILRRCPILETLDSDLYHSVPILKGTKPGDVPVCLSNKLKHITINFVTNGDDELHFVKFVLTRASELEMLYVTLDCDEIDEVTLDREHDFCENLYGFPKKKENCVVEFGGRYFNASSEKFKGGRQRGFKGAKYYFKLLVVD